MHWTPLSRLHNEIRQDSRNFKCSASNGDLKNIYFVPAHTSVSLPKHLSSDVGLSMYFCLLTPFLGQFFAEQSLSCRLCAVCCRSVVTAGYICGPNKYVNPRRATLHEVLWNATIKTENKNKNKEEGKDSLLLKYAVPIGQYLPTSTMHFRGGTKARKLAEHSGKEK